jgi:hypothetical protein
MGSLSLLWRLRMAMDYVVIESSRRGSQIFSKEFNSFVPSPLMAAWKQVHPVARAGGSVGLFSSRGSTCSRDPACPCIPSLASFRHSSIHH